MDKETKSRLIEHLRKLANKEIMPVNKEHGLCFELNEVFSVDYNYLMNIMWDYPNHSGCMLYPIKSTNKRLTPKQQFHNTKNKWRGRQGEERRKLCSWLADRLENENE